MHAENRRVLQPDPCGSRKLGSLKAQNEEMSKSLASKEVGVQRLQKQLDEKTQECSVLSRQLQDTLDDAQRQVDTPPAAAPSSHAWRERSPPAGGKQHAEGSGQGEDVSVQSVGPAEPAEPSQSRAEPAAAQQRGGSGPLGWVGTGSDLVTDYGLLPQMERRYRTQLQNMKDRLEQSDSKNRSLQNYVHFLKTSYGNNTPAD